MKAEKKKSAVYWLCSYTAGMQAYVSNLGPSDLVSSGPTIIVLEDKNQATLYNTGPEISSS